MVTKAQQRRTTAATAKSLSEPTKKLPTVSLPTFTQPAPAPATQDQNPRPESDHPQEETPFLRQAEDVGGEKSSWTNAVHTPISSAGEDGPIVRKTLAPEHTAKVVASLLKIVFWGAEQLMLRTGRKLRRPTEDQMLDMAEPTSTLIVRHTPLAYAPESLVDISQLAGAVADYLQDGPLVTPAYPVQHLGTESQDHPGEVPPSSYVPAQGATSEPAVSYLQ